MRISIQPMLLVLALLAACSRAPRREAYSFEKRAGVVFERAGRACLSIDAADLAPGTRVSVLPLRGPLMLAEAEVVGRSGDCSGYELKMLFGAMSKAAPAVGLIGFTGSIKTRDGAVAADLDADGEPEVFRYCTVAGGIQVTVWNGKPLEGARRWRRYQAVENSAGGPVCMPRETE